MKRHYLQALVCAAAGLAVSIALLFAGLGAPGSADGAGEAIGRLFAMCAIAAAICAWQAGRAAVPWSWFRFAGTYAIVCVVLLLLAASGKARGDDVAAHSMVVWPDGWTIQRLAGLSSADADRGLGWRERAVHGDAARPDAAIELSCATGARGSVDLAGIVEGLLEGYRRQGFVAAASPPSAIAGGVPRGQAVTLTANRDGVELVQEYAAFDTPSCAVVLSYSARRGTFEKYRADYLGVRASLR